jgi:nucleotide-binding universal stress UspA family protein
MAAIGFTPYSEGIFSYAARVAERLDAELLVASVINIRDVNAVQTISAMGYEVDGEHYTTGIREERLQTLQRFMEQTAFPQSRVRSIIPVGHPVEQLLRIAVQEQVDLIVMGVKGRTDLEHALVGSVAEKMFRRSPVPILSYRDAKSAERLRKQIAAGEI